MSIRTMASSSSKRNSPKLGQLSLANARRTQEKEGTDGAFGSFRPARALGWRVITVTGSAWPITLSCRGFHPQEFDGLARQLATEPVQ